MENYFWFVVLVAAIIATIFMFIKASKASKARSAQQKKMMKQMKKMAEIKEKFEVITPETFEKIPVADLFEGIALHIQFVLEKQEDMTAAFEKMPKEKQYIYTLYYMFLEDDKNIDDFFKDNGEELISLSVPAVKEVVNNDRLTGLITVLFNMSDYGNEDVSFDEEKYAYVCQEVEKLLADFPLKETVGKYLIDNRSIFFTQTEK